MIPAGVLRRALPLACLALLAAAPAAPQETGEGREGVLSNDAFLPTSREIATLIARGDAALAPIGPPERLSLENETERLAAGAALESWFEALRDAPPGTTVPVDPAGLVAEERVRWPDPDATASRRTESVERAVLRRLAQSDPGLADLWRERVDPEALEALENAGTRAAALARVEGRFPATRSAALAALRSADLALEGGRPAIAQSWLERASTQASLCAAPEIEAALAARRQAARALEDRRRAGAVPAWSRAADLAQDAIVPLVAAGSRVLGRKPPRTGLIRIDARTLAAQVEGVVWFIDDRGRQRAFEPSARALDLDLAAPAPSGGRTAGWAQLPASDGRTLYIVEGRAGTRLVRRNDPLQQGTQEVWQSNMLMAVVPPIAVELPRVRWVLGPEEWLAPDGRRTPLSEVLEPGMWEFQPGPLVVGSLLLVQARRFPLSDAAEPAPVAPAEARCHLLALDRGTGAIVWQRFLGRATDLQPELAMRFNRRDLVSTPAQPIVRAGSLAFVGTSLGLGLVVELADGRLVTSLRNRRRAAESDGWQGYGRPPIVPGTPPVVLWAPPDSDHLYPLKLESSPSAGPLFALPPLPIGEAEELVGGDLERLYVVGRAGGRHTFSAWEPRSGGRIDSIYFGRGERPLPGALVAADRGVVATERGLYVLDLSRELYLLQHIAFPVDRGQPTGGLFSDGESLLLLADRVLRRFVALDPRRHGR